MELDQQSSKRLKSLKGYLTVPKDEEKSRSLQRTMHVEGVGVVKVVPDLCHLLIKITSQKQTVSQAKDSVERRLAYVKQTIQNCQIQETDMKTFQSVESGYIHTVEIFVTTTEASKLYELGETLTQKLDDTVYVSPVSYSVSTSALAHGRSQSASNAVQNAKKKASEMARLVEGSLGPPISVEQLECEESPISSINEINTGSQFGSWQRACVSMASAVRIMFELRARKNS
ncbi:interleukin-1 receptor-associated kinase 1-binding protein 1-like [Watersipora subatra]|uniref:interleukin-1 receptor-associated kinase 1-binding protein 1-like n=1 Tax=Watersipora subatra TaxID=2589382 RepID=UPI00355C78C7